MHHEKNHRIGGEEVLVDDKVQTRRIP